MQVGVLFSVCDGPLGDEQHFDRFITELGRLGFPFAVNFDHCNRATKKLFKEHCLYAGGYEMDGSHEVFGEDSRQNALRILQQQKFDWALSLDVDETLELDAPEKVRMLAQTRQDLDVIDFRVMDLWGDQDKRPLYYRTDGPFQSSHREKMFNLGSPRGTFRYTHATVHAPKLHEAPGQGNAQVLKYYECYVLHWGIMTPADARFHVDRWNRVYTARVGNNPYRDGFYKYIVDPTIEPRLAEVPVEVSG